MALSEKLFVRGAVLRYEIKKLVLSLNIDPELNGKLMSGSGIGVPNNAKYC